MSGLIAWLDRVLDADGSRAKAKRLRRERDRPIPHSIAWYLTEDERQMWARGWRIGYWICASCGEERKDTSHGYMVLRGWAVPYKNCHCPGTSF